MATQTVTTEDGREMAVPDTVTITVNIGKRTRHDKGYITDEQMTLSTPYGWYINEEIPALLSRFIQNPQLETKQGDIRKWVCPAGQHIKPEKFKELVEKEDGITVTRHQENCGRHNTTRLELEIEVNQ
jgi:hypothetical protein